MRPAGIVLAFERPERIDSVLLYGKWRVRIVRELTREEFDAQLRKNKEQPDAVGMVATVKASKVLTDKAQDSSEPPAEMKYFYAGDLV